MISFPNSKYLLLIGTLFFHLNFFAQKKLKSSQQKFQKQNTMENKMKIEVWSDVVCPFCYIGKRKLDLILQNFEHKNKIQIEWKSFQLDPEMITQPNKNINQYLSERKGIPLKKAQELNEYVSNMAKEVGLHYNLDKAIPANTLKAHQLIHYAKKFGKQTEAEELLFQSYFIDGKNIDDINTLLEVAKSLGLNTNELKDILENNKLVNEVQQDIYEAKQLGISGVPFFLFNDKYAISGAQDIKVFSHTLDKAYKDWEKENQSTTIETIKGKVCTPDGECK
ncbi:MAG: DSBA oxidoreductase [Bacteroidia bacterium]|nr:MAG: DSBA oxidoreductase [Bacteroidia bacterium]GIV28806.1 MAG: DSBA oxidoreductase [Bacteroidia bacterium]